MNRIFHEYLFSKGILVGEKPTKNIYEVLFTLYKKFGIKINDGQPDADEAMIPFVSEMLGIAVPEPFYRGFPATVRSLAADKLLYDQLNHYTVTDGFGSFNEEGHSQFEEKLERLAFNENVKPRSFVIMKEEEAVSLIADLVEDILRSSRPASDSQYDLVESFIAEYHYSIKNCACKETAVRLLIDTGDVEYARFLNLSDVIKLVDTINYQHYGNDNIKKLNLKNRDRRLISATIDRLFELKRPDADTCFEKKAIWSGILHHIHYKPKCAASERFVSLMRGRSNCSAYAIFERAMALGDIEEAVTVLRVRKGSGAILRNLNYIISRCKDRADIDYVMKSLKTKNAVVLIQLMMQYAGYKTEGGRTFKFTRHNKLKLHKETDREQAARGTRLHPITAAELTVAIRDRLRDLLRDRLGRVYISPEMYNVALPIQENCSQGGAGVLPKGSRIHIEGGKKIRAFTYWERVNDIDLSVIGITREGRQVEFSWRTMAHNQSGEITYSGDQTSGYNGGSEYFDVDPALFREKHPDVKYLIFCNNVFSRTPFADCVCRAGYMLRDSEDTGEIFEPRTVESSFTVNCDSTFAYLFGIDLDKKDFVWLNMAREGRLAVAGASDMSFLTDYFSATSVINVGSLFEMLATELVSDPTSADVVVSDRDMLIPDTTERIRPSSFERINALISY